MSAFVTSGAGVGGGGLGNQLFRIAATLDYANKYNKIPIFGNLNINYYTKAMLLLNKCYTEFFNNKLNVISLEEFKSINFTKFEEIHSRKYTHFPNHEGNVYIGSYLECYKYISDSTRDKMNELIKSNPEFVNIANSLFNIIKKHFNDTNEENYMFIHFRRGDVSENNPAEYNFDYIQKAYEKIKSIKNNQEMNVVVFSDDINWCYDNVKCFPKVYFLDNISNQYIELILMSMFNSGILTQIGYHGSTTNFHRSSFSWWGAFLGNKNKTITIPDRSDETTDYYLPEWIEV